MGGGISGAGVCPVEASPVIHSLRIGCRAYGEGMRPISVHPGYLPGFLGHSEKRGSLHFPEPLYLSSRALQRSAGQSPLLQCPPQCTRQHGRTLQPSPLANLRAFHRSQKPPSPISRHSLSSPPKESPILNFYNVLF